VLDYFFGFARQLTARSNIYTPIVTNRFRMCKSCVTSTWRNRYRRLPSRSRRSALLANWFTGASGDFCGRLGLAGRNVPVSCCTRSLSLARRSSFVTYSWL